MWFGSVSYIISDTHITKRCGIFFIQEQTMRLQALQYSTIIRTPVSEKTGMNFIPLHAYGGMILLAFLKPEDAQEIQKFYSTGCIISIRSIRSTRSIRLHPERRRFYALFKLRISN